MSINDNACRSCHASLRWVRSAASHNSLPLNADPDPRGNIVVDYSAAEECELATVLKKGDPRRDDPKVTKYLNHFVTCPQSKQWRRGA
jgi:hypothetical protein